MALLRPLWPMGPDDRDDVQQVRVRRDSMTKSQTSVYLRDEQIEAIADLARESQQRDDLPDLSKSEVHRRLLDAGIETDPQLSELIPDHREILYQRERFIDGEVKLQRLRTGFEGRCKRTTKTRFKQGIRPDELDRLGEGLKRDATILWPDDDDRRGEAIDYVDRLIDACRDAIETSDFDPLDPDTIFGSFETVAEAVEREDADDSGVIEALRSEIRDRIDRAGDLNALADALAKQYDLDRDVVRDEIDQISRDRDDSPITVAGSPPPLSEIETQND